MQEGVGVKGSAGAGRVGGPTADFLFGLCGSYVVGAKR